MTDDHTLNVRLPAALVRWFSELTYQGMFATDCDLRVIVWNRWMEIHSERPASDVLGRALTELYPELRSRGLEQYYRDALNGQISMMSYGLHRHVLRMPPTNRDLGFSDMPQSGRIGPLSDGEAVIGTVTVLEDVSDRLASDAALRRQIDVQHMARVAAEKALRAKDEFLSTVSHEIRNPLNAVLGWTRILIDRKDVEPDVLARALRVIDRNAAAQARMIDDLLDVARIASGKLRLEMQPVDLVAVALAAVDVVGPAAAIKKIDVRTQLDPKTPRVLGDPQRLQQIIWNLLSNAVKFTDSGGVVDVAVSPVGKAVAPRRARFRQRHQPGVPALCVRAVSPERCVERQASRRTGPRSRARSRARRASWRYGPCRERRGRSGRHLHDRLADDELTRFAAQPSGQRPSETHPGAVAGGLRLLIVEDEVDSRELLAAAMTKCGAQVVTASSCDEALDAIRRATAAKNLPHVILSDIGMPKRDGFDLIRRVRALPPEEGGRIPAVAVTGYADLDDGQRAIEAGFHSHLPKPVDPIAIAMEVLRAARDADG